MSFEVANTNHKEPRAYPKLVYNASTVSKQPQHQQLSDSNSVCEPVALPAYWLWFGVWDGFAVAGWSMSAGEHSVHLPAGTASASFSAPAPGGNGLVRGGAACGRRVIAAMRAASDRHRARAELRQLSDHLLKDIGLTRFDRARLSEQLGAVC